MSIANKNGGIKYSGAMFPYLKKEIIFSYFLGVISRDFQGGTEAVFREILCENRQESR